MATVFQRMFTKAGTYHFHLDPTGQHLVSEISLFCSQTGGQVKTVSSKIMKERYIFK